MTDCECLPKCPFFHDKMSNMPSMAEILKQRYCHAGWKTCARHRVFMEFGSASVPFDLFPNENERADMLLLELRV